MADLLLHEERIKTVFDEVGDIGVPQTVRAEPTWQGDRQCRCDVAVPAAR